MDRDVAWHTRVQSWWERATEDILVPVVALPEVAYLLGSRIGAVAETAFARAVGAGELVLEPLLSEDIVRAADLMSIYADARLGLVDTCIMAAAERLEILGILTTDRRHFSLVRPRHTTSFRLLP
jgi:predicted nucleic acid-binding protein